ncbi:MAG: dephospho-CoA kinase [Betaproteobacteria bacterium]|nr:dephospho-CoA kinase [Betaproteobacteria bacterium]
MSGPILNTGLAQSPPFMAESSETERNREPKAPQDRIEESPAFRQGGLKIGLTGGLGSGKSTVAARFASHGIDIVDTDAIARELAAPGGAAIPALRAVFGESAIAADGGLDRARMRALAFADRDARARLEGILHPLIGAESLRRSSAARSPYVIIDVPLLVETGHWRKRCDRVCVVDCPLELQISRVVGRDGHSRNEIEAILAAQASREARLAVADDVIDNSGTLDDLLTRVDALHARYLALAAVIPSASRAT